jgi:cell division protein FtsQ
MHQALKDKLDLNKLENPEFKWYDWKIRCVCKYWWCLKSSGKTKTPIARVMNGNNSFILIMKEVNHYQIILQLEFHLFRGNKKINSEDLPNCVGLFMTMNFENIIAIQIMPSGNLKMFNRNYDYQMILEGSRCFKI